MVMYSCHFFVSSKPTAKYEGRPSRHQRDAADVAQRSDALDGQQVHVTLRRLLHHTVAVVTPAPSRVGEGHK
jgi:hypothetical protein